MIAWIYQIRNTATNQCYVGSSINIQKRKQRHFFDLEHNKHHNIHLQRAFNKYGAGLFVFEIIQELVVNTESDIRLVEQQYLDTGINLYNIGTQATGGDNLSSHPNKIDIQQRKGESIRQTRSRMTQQERNTKYGHAGDKNGMFGKTHTDEVRQKLSECAKHRVGSSLMASIGKARLGKTNKELYGDEVAALISAKLSKCGRQRTGVLNSFFGKHHTDEFKHTASINRINRYQNMTVWDKLNHPQMKPILIDGVLYLGCSEAAKAIGCTPGNITYKLKSLAYPNYQYITKDEAMEYLQTLSIMKTDDYPLTLNQKSDIIDTSKYFQNDTNASNQ